MHPLAAASVLTIALRFAFRSKHGKLCGSFLAPSLDSLTEGWLVGGPPSRLSMAHLVPGHPTQGLAAFGGTAHKRANKTNDTTEEIVDGFMSDVGNELEHISCTQTCRRPSKDDSCRNAPVHPPARAKDAMASVMDRLNLKWLKSMKTERTYAALDPFDVLFIQHGNAENHAASLRRVQKQPPYNIDPERMLTDTGRRQSLRASETFMRELPCMELAPFAVTSPTARCRETARFVLKGSRASRPIKLVECCSLYDELFQPGAGGTLTSSLC